MQEADSSQSSSQEGNANNSDSNQITIKQLFDYKRFENYSDIVLLSFYIPLGICLFIIRLFIFLHLLLISNLLPKDSSIRSVIFRILFFVLGVVIQEENLPLKELNARLIISNRVSDLDPLVINLVYPCEFLSTSYFPRYIHWLFGTNEFTIAQFKKNKNLISNKSDSTPVLCFPESSATNGRFGLFQFENWPFTCDLPSHLIFIEAKRFLINVNVSPLESNSIINLFWVLFLPFTIFNIRYLCSMKRNENETVELYTKRVQLEMASKTKLFPSSFNLDDKREMIKRFKADQIKNFQTNTQIKPIKIQDVKLKKTLTIDDMAIKVKEVLPQVPLSVIKRDIAITKNIDDTIDRILGGNVNYIPETLNDSKIEPNQSTKTLAPITNSEANKMFYCGASTFGKNASDRSKSFEERKEQLFELARRRYIEKCELKNTSS